MGAKLGIVQQISLREAFRRPRLTQRNPFYDRIFGLSVRVFVTKCFNASFWEPYSLVDVIKVFFGRKHVVT